MNTRQVCFLSFAAIAGLSLIMLGPVMQTTRPYFLLDVVLTPEQFRDEELRERTLAQLKQGETLDWTLPYIAGLFLITVGGIGLAIHLLRPRFQSITT